jgi:hypothetical protein
VPESAKICTDGQQSKYNKSTSLPTFSAFLNIRLSKHKNYIPSFTMKLTFFLLSALTGCIAASPLQRLSIISSRQLEACPPNGNLPQNYLSPTLMVPVSRNFPDVAFGSTRVPKMTPNDFCTIFNLVIPPSAMGATCTLEFLFPSFGETLSPYFYNGGGHFTFTGYAFGTESSHTTVGSEPWQCIHGQCRTLWGPGAKQLGGQWDVVQ